MIQLDHIDVTFQQKKRQIQAVKDVTIHIQERDIYGIVGYSGAGKSTLVRVINLLQVPTSGKIIVDDDVLFDNKVTLTAEQLRRKRQDIGMIFQHFNLMSQLTAEENVAFALKHSGLSKEEKNFEFINYIQKQMLHFQSEVKIKEEQILTKDRIIMLKDEQLISRDEIIKAKDKEINQLTQKLIGLYEQEKINQELLVSKKKKTIFNFFKRR